MVTDPGIVTDVRLTQSRKVPSSIIVIELGIVTDVMLRQPAKAPASIAVTGYVIPSYAAVEGIVMSPLIYQDAAETLQVLSFM
jgi:hypothetical protein